MGEPTYIITRAQGSYDSYRETPVFAHSDREACEAWIEHNEPNIQDIGTKWEAFERRYYNDEITERGYSSRRTALVNKAKKIDPTISGIFDVTDDVTYMINQATVLPDAN